MPASPLTPEQRRLRAQIAANTRWSREPDRAAATQPATAGFFARFENEVDPDRRLDPAERERRAKNARSAYMAKLALRSSKARRSSSTRVNTSPDAHRPLPVAEAGAESSCGADLDGGARVRS